MLIRIATRAAKKIETEGGSVACRPALVYSTAQNRELKTTNSGVIFIFFLDKLCYNIQRVDAKGITFRVITQFLFYTDAYRRIGRPG